MLRPQDVKSTFFRDYDLEQLAMLEEQFDLAIRVAESTGKWPAVVGNARDGARQALIEQTIAKYRSAGWVISAPSGLRAQIERPT